MPTEEKVVLVDEDDIVIGEEEKLYAHKKALLHRAVSVFLFDNQGRWLLQRRALGKYHSPGLWSNSCCTHPRLPETYIQAAQRRLEEEMGIICHIEHLFSFVYNIEVGQGLTEHELDHVFVGIYNGSALPDEHEVMDCRFVSYAQIQAELSKMPGNYTVWFRHIVERVNHESAAWLHNRTIQ
jgi:isopentenyl-diphosphate Delta-isomerase